ncbi:MAG: hypothetical protein ABIT01_04600, partial [Thermoanaerobaculia bacterium]
DFRSGTRLLFRKTRLLVIADSRNPGTVYVATTDGVFKSVTGGNRWVRLSFDLSTLNTTVVRLHDDSSSLFVGTGGASAASFRQRAPEIDSADPPSASTTPTRISVLGSHFMPGARLFLGDLPAEDVVVLDEHTITGRVSASPEKSVDLVVENPTLQRGVLRHGLTYTAPCVTPNYPALNLPGVVGGTGQPVVVDATGSDATRYAWTIANGTITAGQGTPHITIVPASTGILVVQATAYTDTGCASLTATAGATIGGARAVEVASPIVLDVFGRQSSHFTSALTLTNRSPRSTQLLLAYTPSRALGGTGAGITALTLEPGQQTTIDDVLAYLRDAGLPIPLTSPAAPQGGVLRAMTAGAATDSDVTLSTRTTTPTGGGRAGLAYPAVPTDNTASGLLCGLRETATERTNIALLNPGQRGTCTLRVKLHDGDTPRTETLPEVTLAPGQWVQLNSPLASLGMAQAYAEVTRVEGSGSFYAYSVVNDNISNDGSYVGMVSSGATGRVQVLPVAVATASFVTDAVIANPTDHPVSLTLHYRESLGGPGQGNASLTLSASTQRLIPDVVEWLHTTGVWSGPWTGDHAGTLVADAENEQDSFVLSGRTVTRDAGAETFGLGYPAMTSAAAARDETWVCGLRSDASERSNLGIANAGTTDLILQVELFDGRTASGVFLSEPFALEAGAWKQFNAILPPGIEEGFARVRRLSGSGLFLAYGVINDGASPGQGTGDGTYLEMVGAK